jgi:hypothetical protein
MIARCHQLAKGGTRVAASTSTRTPTSRAFNGRETSIILVLPAGRTRTLCRSDPDGCSGAETAQRSLDQTTPFLFYIEVSAARRVASMTAFIAGVGSPKVTRLNVCSIGNSVVNSGRFRCLESASWANPRELASCSIT